MPASFMIISKHDKKIIRLRPQQYLHKFGDIIQPTKSSNVVILTTPLVAKMVFWCKRKTVYLKKKMVLQSQNTLGISG